MSKNAVTPSEKRRHGDTPRGFSTPSELKNGYQPKPEKAPAYPKVWRTPQNGTVTPSQLKEDVKHSPKVGRTPQNGTVTPSQLKTERVANRAALRSKFMDGRRPAPKPTASTPKPAATSAFKGMAGRVASALGKFAGGAALALTPNDSIATDAQEKAEMQKFAATAKQKVVAPTRSNNTTTRATPTPSMPAFTRTPKPDVPAERTKGGYTLSMKG